MGVDICPTVLWAPSTPIPDKHGEAPPHAAGHQQCCGRRHLPYQANMVKPSTCLWISTAWQTPTSAIPEEDDATSHMHLTLTVLWAPTIILYPMAWATRLSICTLSLSLSLVRSSPLSIKGDAISPKKGRSIQDTTTEPPGSNLEHTLKHLAHHGAPVTLGPSDQSPTGPLVPPSFSLPFVTSQQTSSTWVQE